MTNEEAVKILKEEILGLSEDNPFYEAVDLAMKALERPHGRWLPINYKGEVIENVRETVWDEVYAPRFKCSECGCDDFASTYCPNCGALMEDSEDVENDF